MSTQAATTDATVTAVDAQIIVVEQSLAAMSFNTAEQAGTADVDDHEEEVDGANIQLQEELVALRSSQTLLAELARLVEKDEVEKLTKSGHDHSVSVSFGANNSGLQTGVSYGTISWNNGR